MKFHIDGKGEIKPCAARIKNCKYSENAPHFNSISDAEKFISENNITLPVKLSKNNSKGGRKLKDYRTFGVGEGRVLKIEDSEYLNGEDIVTLKECEGIPEQHFNGETSEILLKDYKEVSLNGEVLGYINYCEEYGYYMQQSLEKINDPHAINNQLLFDAVNEEDAALELIKHHLDFIVKDIDLNNLSKYLLPENTQVNVLKIDDSTHVIACERKVYDMDNFQQSFHYFYFIKNGKAVSYIKMNDIRTIEDSKIIDRKCERSYVETRNSYRRRGYAKELSQIIESKYKIKLESSGRFTELGRAAFGANAAVEAKRNIRAMNFVEDWDTLNLKENSI